jgi:2-polyprenyl-3-methyl-5-hydroxy-6-metoxy-1,4-benzoquinol methylase
MSRGDTIDRVSAGNVDVVDRAKQSKGISHAAIYAAVRLVIENCRCSRQTLLDVGCGTGQLLASVRDLVDCYHGTDIVRYAELPTDAEFIPADLDSGVVPLPDGFADIVVAVETIEHLENPRAFMRELSRLCAPGGLVVVTTPNQLSLLSKLTLVVKDQFNAFQDVCYPAHLTALLAEDLRRIARECGLVDTRIQYSGDGRMPGVPWHYPEFLGQWMPKSFSDNVVLSARQPVVASANAIEST